LQQLIRTGTPDKLEYQHIKQDLEKRQNSSPDIHAEAEITKGKYRDYDAFLRRDKSNIPKLGFTK
jgi:hypothetical protein